VAFLLEVEQLGSGTEQDLRDRLGYSGTFDAAIATLFASSPRGLLVFDGFDAARGAEVRERLILRLRHVVLSCPAGWTVLVSVRTYDAMKSPTLRALFPIQDRQGESRFRKPEIAARHFHIPELTEPEVLSALESIHGIDPERFARESRTIQMLRRPFYLWLLEWVALAGAPQDELVPLDVDVELLDLYWRTIVREKPDELHRAAVIRKLTTGMVEARRLSIDATTFLTPGGDAAWEGLRSDGLLVVGEGEERGAAGSTSVRFAHNILFDYAVSRTVVPNSAADLAEFLREDPTRALFLRASLSLSFGEAWLHSREEFWREYQNGMRVTTAEGRLVFQTMPAVTVVENARSFDDLSPMVAMWQSGEQGSGQIISRNFLALRFRPIGSRRAWLQAASVLAESPDPVFAWELGMFFAAPVESEPPEERRVRSEAANRLLRECLERGALAAGDQFWDRLGGGVVLSTVLELAEMRPQETLELCRSAMQLLDLDRMPLGYFHQLTSAVGKLAALDPDFVEELYLRLFGHSEDPDVPTTMGTPSMVLTSNRQQDFESNWYALGRAYPEFLTAAPLVALKTGVRLLDAAARRRLRPPRRRIWEPEAEEGEPSGTFVFRGRTCTLYESSAWFELEWKHSDLMSIQQGIISWSKSRSDAAEAVVEAFMGEASAMSTWQLLLRIGAASPETFASQLRPLLLVPLILRTSDLWLPYGECVRAVFPFWSEADRAEWEHLVLDEHRDARGDVARVAYVRFLEWAVGVVPRTQLATLEARDLRSEIDERGNTDAPVTDPRVWSSSREYTTTDWLRDQGVDVDGAVQSEVIRTMEEWKEEGRQWSNKTPDGSGASRLEQVLRAALDRSEKVTGLESSLRSQYWASVGECATALARTKPLKGTARWNLVQEVLARCWSFPEPAPSPERDQEYQSAHWSPGPRTEAIDAWSWLLAASCSDDGVEILREAASSPEPSERLLAVLYAGRYFESCPDAFWAVVTMVAEREKNQVVAQHALRILLSTGGVSDTRREAPVRTLVERFRGASERELDRERAEALTYFGVVVPSEWAGAEWKRVLEGFPNDVGLLTAFCHRAAWLVLTAGMKLEARRGIQARLAEVLFHAERTARAEQSASLEEAEAGASSVAARKAYFECVDSLVLGVWQVMYRAGESDGLKMERIEEGLGPILDLMQQVLADAGEGQSLGVPPNTAHRVLELSRKLLPMVPGRAIQMASEVSLASGRYGSAQDSLAVSEVVGLVEEALADHPRVLAEDQTAGYLISLLEHFVEAGWPEAIRVVWRLDEVYR